MELEGLKPPNCHLLLLSPTGDDSSDLFECFLIGKVVIIMLVSLGGCEEQMR